MTIAGSVRQGWRGQMPQRDPNFVAAKWSRNLGSSTDSIKAGVEAVTVSPTERAAARADDWAAGVARSKDKFQRGLRRVSLEDWKRATVEKGLNRVATGAQAAEPKMADFMREFLPHVERVATAVRAMPKGGLENGIARATAQIRGNASFRRSGS